ncbi:MAG: sugar transferase, partial [Bdellovibrionaceae bacterium]|nr:sugar transferase [Pseudobdellovibrionaceae bacterium]
IIASAAGLLIASPVLLPTMILVWWQDYHSPFYVAPRMGRNEKPFRMVKMRSMVMNADKSGVDSTSANDRRITGVGHFIRRYKLDELTQLWNVLTGDMSLVGPRPNVKRETDLYTPVEKQLLTVRPGITDLASIVFSDEGEILKDSKDPDLDYNQRIRPWKSRLALITVENQGILLSLRICFLTVLTVVSRESALRGVQAILNEVGADEQLKQVAARQQPLKPFPPPGATEIVMSRTVVS